MIIATAGHVDHGKTALVKALTGIDADRLPDEKRRGMTIDLGFAYWRLAPDKIIGFVDVPGHERFIRNMLCGVTGIDFVLLVVAADDGVMPQTMEHVAIVDLLGAKRGAVALTKVDRVEPARVTEASAAVRALLSDTGLNAAPIFPVSSITGDGIAALKDHLATAALAEATRAAGGRFRLAIDRVFTIAGAGLVVTGTVFAGTVAVGERVRIAGAQIWARVRAIHAQNSAARSGHHGERCALNLAGAEIAPDRIARGDWVVAEDVAAPAAKFDARIHVLRHEARALAHWTPVHVHLGAADVTGRVAILEAASVAPGGSGLVQLVLDHPIGAVWGDGIVLRDQTAQRTIAGGTVIDIFPPRRGRARPERLAFLTAMERADDAMALSQLVAGAAAGFDLDRFAANRNIAAAAVDALAASQKLRIVATASSRLGFWPARWDELKEAAVAALAAAHRRAPDAVGLLEDRLFVGSAVKLPQEVARAVAAELVREGTIVRDGAAVRLPAHQAKLAPADAALWRRIEPSIDRQKLRPPSVHEIAAELEANPRAIESLMVRLARLGLLVRVAPNRFYRPAALRELGTIAARVSADAADHRITAAQFRDRSGVGRNVAIELLEYFDRIKFTRRIGDAHEIVRGVEDAFGAASETVGSIPDC